MVVNRRKKSNRMQGSATHGWGKNKHRNSGSRGGYGNAGSGKKSHGKKPSYWADESYFGRHGFVSQNPSVKGEMITLRDVDLKVPQWIKEKKAASESGKVVVDLGQLGYQKLLGTGKLSRAIKITVPQASQSVKAKVEAAKGELVMSQ
ncbi:uL15 family ribosomal protein [Candidatus Woesearchaeota archaeon]|nr:uL15 family ribosomal protein [Candidatus Woesearchaeota archaeon]